MALNPAKRPREGARSLSKPRKRARTSKDLPTASVLPNQLNWKTVALPDRLEDAEGFFGLEEIDGVDVIRNGASGEVQYRYVHAKAGKQPRNDRQNGKHMTQDDHESEAAIDGEAEEWEGFSDEASDGHVQPPLQSAVTGHKSLKGGQKIPKPAKSKKKKNTPTEPLANSTSIDGNIFATLDDEAQDEETDVSAWDSLGLSAECLLSLSKLGFSRPTPIQSAAIPEIRAKHDVIGKAVTGSGKTLAFGIPILEEYLESRDRDSSAIKRAKEGSGDAPLALILSPTRELAHQISKHLGALFSNVPSGAPAIATVTGGLSLQKQRRLLANADVIIATPGRLWEVINEGTGFIAWVKRTRYLVVDEADRLLSEGHFKEFEEILRVLDQEEDDAEEEAEEQPPSDGDHGQDARDNRQTLVFSATFHKGLQHKLSGGRRYEAANLMDSKQSIDYVLQRLNFREEKPMYIDVNPISQMADRLKEGLVECAALEKDLYLYALLLYTTGKRTLIFTNSISSVRRLTSFLQNLNFSAQALHSQMIQKARLRSIERFAGLSDQHSILIATDVAARGLDIPHVDLILHYHVPRTADMYIHRSGRTARAEESGSSILICSPDEVAGVRRLVAKVHAANEAKGSKPRAYIRSLDMNRKVIARLKPRVTLAKRIVDAMMAKEKKGAEDDWLRTAADQLGVDYDSDEFEAVNGMGKRRGKGREKAAREARSLSKDDLSGMRRELKDLLKQRVNVGVSEKYLTRGGVDIDELLEKRDTGQFLGKLDDIDFEA